MISDNYFFIDGSALTGQIRRLRKADPSFKDRRLCPKKFVSHFMNRLIELHGGAYKRATFYFPNGDDEVGRDYLLLPDLKRPGEIRDIHFKYCGEKLKKSAVFDKIVEEFIPEEFRDRVSKSEKGVDIEICCDALRLATRSKVDRLFLLTNDRDFIPLCRTLKEFGANVSLIYLSAATSPGTELLSEVDSYDLISFEELQNMFLPLPEQTPPPPQVQDIVSAEKPEAAPSDLDTSQQVEVEKILAEPGEAIADVTFIEDEPSKEEGGD